MSYPMVTMFNSHMPFGFSVTFSPNLTGTGPQINRIRARAGREHEGAGEQMDRPRPQPTRRVYKRERELLTRNRQRTNKGCFDISMTVGEQKRCSAVTSHHRIIANE